MDPMTDTPPPPSLVSRWRDTGLGLAIYAPIALARLLPYRWRVPAMGWVTSRIISPIAGYDRRVRENLDHVLPDLPEPEVRRLSRAVADNAGRNMVELHSTPEFIARTRDIPLEGPGLSAIRAARAEGRPVIFVTGHFGNFHAARVALVAQGFDMGIFYRPMANAFYNRRYTHCMEMLSTPMFQQGRGGMRQMVRHLRSGGVLAILTDLNALDGVPLDFFGKPALSSLATAEMALKFDAPLVPVWAIRQPDGLSFRVIVEAPIPPSDPVTMTQEVNDRLEAQVREHMDQWFWIHRRWKNGTGHLADRAARQLERQQQGRDRS